MLRLAVRELLSRRLAFGLTAAALASALVGAIAIAAVSDRTTATLHGSVQQAWHSPFDLLVRPQYAVSDTERERGLVRPNYLTGTIGGISDRQLRAIRSIAGVQVAAPVAMVGYAEWPGQLTFDLERLVGRRPYAFLRLRARVRADAGMSVFRRAIRPEYLLVAPDGTIVDRFAGAAGVVGEVLRADGKTFRCAPLGELSSARRPRCLGARLKVISDQGIERYPAGRRWWPVPLRLPLLLAGIDPAAERDLTGVDRCLTAGRYLRAAALREHVVRHPQLALGIDQIHGDWDAVAVTDVPLLASERSFLGESIETLVDTARPGPGPRWRPVLRTRRSAESIYRNSLGRIGRALLANGTLVAAGDVRYQALGPSRLRALPQPQRLSALDNPVFEDRGSGRMYGPVEAHDTWLRLLSERQLQLGRVASSRFRLTGRYDPTCLPGFDPLAGARLDVAAPPEVSLPTDATLLPSRSPAGYVSPPPLMLTTLQGARFFADPQMYTGAPGAKYISAVRVRVSNVARPDAASRRRLERVALAIHERTGLRVDVVKGASVRDMGVALPAGRFGRPPLDVREKWSVKGVAVRFSDAISAQSIALLIVALGCAGLLTGQTAYIAVRRRHPEFAALRAMGWRRRDLAALVSCENLLLGTLAGTAAAAIGLTLLAISGAASPAAAAAGLPVAVALAALGGLPAAMQAGRGSVTERFAYQPRLRLSRPPRTAAGVGIRGLRPSWRGEALVAVVALTVGAASVGGVVLVAAGFNGSLDATVLGRHLAAEAQAPQAAAAALTALLGAGVGAQVLILSCLERQTELACLRALGWPRRSVTAVVVGQGAALSAAAGASAAIAVIGAGLAVGAGTDAVLVAAAATTGAAAIAGMSMIAVPVALTRAAPVEALRER